MTKQELAIQLHKKGYNCCQCVVCAFADELGYDETTLFRAAEGFGLGIGNMKNTCGAVTGLVMSLGLLNSAADLEAPNTTKRATMGLASQCVDQFRDAHGSVICQELKGLTGMPAVACDTCIADAVDTLERAIAAQKV